MEATFDFPAPDIHLPIQNLQPSPALSPCRGHGLPAVPTRTASPSAQCPCPLASPKWEAWCGQCCQRRKRGAGFMLFLWNMGRGMQHLKPESVWRGRDSVGSLPWRALILGKVQVGTTVIVGGHHHLLSPVLHFSRQGLNSFGQNLLSAQLRVWNLTVNKMQFLPSGH